MVLSVPLLLSYRSIGMSTSSFDAADGWDTMEDAGMVITDVAVLSKKEKAGQEYTVVSLDFPWWLRESEPAFCSR